MHAYFFSIIINFLNEIMDKFRVKYLLDVPVSTILD